MEKIKKSLSSPLISSIFIVASLILFCLVMVYSNESSNEKNEIADLQSEITKLQSENEQLTSEKKKLNDEIDELKNGPQRRLEKIQASYDEKDWEQTITLANELHTAYPGGSEDKKGQELKNNAQTEIDKKKEEEKRKKEEEEKRKAEEEARGYETGITYEQLARYPEENIGKKVKFNGKVLQVMKGDGETQIRLAVDSNYDQVILAYFDSSITKGNVLEDDIITIYGLSLGDYTYETVLGSELTVPLVSIDKIDQ